MLKKTITYTDYNGVERKEDFYFNLNEAETLEMEMTMPGGFAGMVQKIIDAKDTPSIIKIFKEFILKAYGEKSADGKLFRKIGSDGHRLADDFAQTEAYSILFMELSTNADSAAKFVNGVTPQKLNENTIANDSVVPTA